MLEDELRKKEGFTDEDFEWCHRRTLGLIQDGLTAEEARDKALSQRRRWRQEQVEKELERERRSRKKDFERRSQGVPTLTARPFEMLLKGKR